MKKRGRQKKNFLDYIFYFLLAIGLLLTIFVWFSSRDQHPSQLGRDQAQRSSSTGKNKSSVSSVRQTSSAAADSSMSLNRLKKEYSLGTLISSDQPYGDFAYLRSQGLSFVYFRSTSGSSNYDDTFSSSASSARKQNMAVGNMTVYDPMTSAYAAYLYFVQKNGTSVGQLPIAISVSDDSVGDQPSVDNLVGLVQDLKVYYPKNSVIVRCDQQTYRRISDDLKLLNIRYWLVGNDLSDKDQRNQFIQYNANGKIGSGIRSFRMPLSVYNGSREDFKNVSQGAGK
ncbi:GH25 family lysozyme [Oenococcus alcoholitolerans]|uniref:GH25 family lysozyme n=1 Tax=Oenococcus alcoholitolerans TaxID=931074 RepID=UPI003F70577F